MEKVDLLVAGGGVAGSSAAILAGREGLRAVVLAPEGPMGALATIERIENFPGLAGVSGYDFCPTLQDQATEAGAEVRWVGAEGARHESGHWIVETPAGEVAAPALIAATGTRPARLGVRGEAELVGRGVSHCASCDGPLFAGKRVAVIGGGDSALQEALTLIEHGAQVRLYQLGGALTAQDAYQARLAGHRAAEVRFNARVEAILGDGSVSALRWCNEVSGEFVEDEVEGVFVYVGRTPVTEWLGGSDVLDADARVRTDAGLRSLLPGLFAAGDVRSGSSGHAAGAAGDGLTAAASAVAYLRARG